MLCIVGLLWRQGIVARKRRITPHLLEMIVVACGIGMDRDAVVAVASTAPDFTLDRMPCNREENVRETRVWSENSVSLNREIESSADWSGFG